MNFTETGGANVELIVEEAYNRQQPDTKNMTRRYLPVRKKEAIMHDAEFNYELIFIEMRKILDRYFADDDDVQLIKTTRPVGIGVVRGDHEVLVMQESSKVTLMLDNIAFRNPCILFRALDSALRYTII